MTTKGALDSLTISDIFIQIPEIQHRFNELTKLYQSRLDHFLENPNIGGIKGLKLLVLEYNDDPIVKEKLGKAIELERYIRGKLPVYQYSFSELSANRFIANLGISDILNDKGSISYAAFLQLVKNKHNLSRQNEELSEHVNLLFAELNLLSLDKDVRKNHPLTQKSEPLLAKIDDNEKLKEDLVKQIGDLGTHYNVLAHFIDCYLTIESLNEKLPQLASVLTSLLELPPRKMQVDAPKDSDEWENSFSPSEGPSTSTIISEDSVGSDSSDLESWDSEFGIEQEVSQAKLPTPSFLVSFKQLQIGHPAQNDNASAAIQPDIAVKPKTGINFPGN